MMETEDWRRTNEDRLSTGSNSDGEMPGPETNLLRMPNVRGVVHYNSSKQRAVITALAFTVLLIVSILFGVLYHSNGNENESHIQKRAPMALADQQVVITEITDSQEHDPSANALIDNEMQSDQPRNTQPVWQRNSNLTSSSSNTRKKSSKNRNRSRVNHHGPRKLPSNAHEIPPFSLLYQLRLVKGKQESFMKYTKCEDLDVDKKRFFKGWKAVLPVNLTAAGFPQNYPHNNFTGYGNQQSDARRRAAEHALTKLYNGTLQYAEKDDLIEIKEFCVEEENSNDKGTVSPVDKEKKT